MTISSADLDYCLSLIKRQDYARYLQLAFAPPELRGCVIAYYALAAELAHIHDHVSEEMIGHIRYAWWREALDALAEGKDRAHPVLQRLLAEKLDVPLLIALVDGYREAWPELPKNPPEFPLADARWKRAGRVIRAHRGARWWLLIKLLFI